MINHRTTPSGCVRGLPRLRPRALLTGLACLAAGLPGVMPVALSGCASGSGKPSIDAAADAVGSEVGGGLPDNPCGLADPGLGERNASELFGMPSIPVFDLALSTAAWQDLQVHARDEQYVPAQACFEGKAIGIVGLRFKGSYGSLYNCFDAAGKNTCRKLGMKIKFDEYADGQSFFGLKRLNFQGYHYDDSYLKERMSYDLYRAMDIVAPRASWAILRVNGESQGLFGMVEQIDGRFTKDRWPQSGDGNLFKECWPGDVDEATLVAALETNQDAANVSAFKAFGTALDAAPDADLRTVLGSFTDLDYFARYMAVDDAIANFDGITTYYTTSTPDQAGNHNFFFYEESASKFTIIPWDLESTLSLMSNFGSVPGWQALPADCTTTYLAWGGPLYVIAPGCNRVFRALAADLTSYRTAATRLLDGAFAEATVLASIDTLAAFVRPAATTDPHGPGAVGFENGVTGLRKEIPSLRRRLQQLVSGKVVVPFQLVVAPVNDFEAADDDGLNAGTSLMSNAHSTTSVTVNASAPLDGNQSLRIGFGFGDEATAWQQWMLYRIPFASAPADLSKLTGIRLKVRSDHPRVLRLDVDSPKNSAGDQGVAVGWQVPVDVATATVTLLLAEAKDPSWAADPGDDLTAILQSATGLIFRPQCNHLDGSGHLPAGVTDEGWIDIDDLEIF